MEHAGFTKIQAGKIGSHKALKYALLVFGVMETLLLFIETRGDFANGILFFMQAQLNPFVLSVVLLFFLSSFILGRWTGVKILIGDKGYVWAAVQSAFITWVLLIGYFFILSSVTGKGADNWPGLALGAFVVVLIFWIAVGWSIRRVKDNSKYGE